MADRNIHIVDLDDGPDGGGGAALASMLRRMEIKHQCWTVSPMDSGWQQNSLAQCVDGPGLLEVIEDLGPDDLVVPGTRAALDWLDTLRGDQDASWQSALEDLLDSPRGFASLTAAVVAEVPIAEHEVIVSKPDRKLCAKIFHGGWILKPDGVLVAVEDGGEAWFRLASLVRKGVGPCALIPSLGRDLFMGLHYFENENGCHHAFFRADSIRPSWRMTMGRTVEGRVWNRAIDDMTHLKLPSGFFQTLWLNAPGQRKARFVASMPLPSSSLVACERELAVAMKSAESGVVTPSGLYYADAPIDFAIDQSTLLERIGR